MRSFFVLLLALSFVSAAAAQTLRVPDAQAASRWTLSAGPDWSILERGVWGLRARADYDLVGRRGPFRLGLLMGGSWGPSQGFVSPLGDGSYYSGRLQRGDLVFGLNAALTPLPGARLSPYFTFGVLARQVWVNGVTYQWNAANPQPAFVERSSTYGHITSTWGWGLRLRLGGRMFQVERRTIYDVKSLTFGTSLPFE